MVKPDIIKNAMAKLRRTGVHFKRKNINNGSGVNNNNSNEGEKTKEMVLGLPSKRGQTLSKTFEGGWLKKVMAAARVQVTLAARAARAVREVYAARAARAERVPRVAAREADGGNGSGDDGGSGDGGGDGGDDGDGSGDNDVGDKTEGDGKMGTKMEPKGQHHNRNRFTYHCGDENGYLVGQLHRCYYQKPNVCSIIPYQVLV